MHLAHNVLKLGCFASGLETLCWANNALAYFPPATLAALGRLRVLDLAHNELSDFEAAPGRMQRGMTPLEACAAKLLRVRRMSPDSSVLHEVRYVELEDDARFEGTAPACIIRRWSS